MQINNLLKKCLIFFKKKILKIVILMLELLINIIKIIYRPYAVLKKKIIYIYYYLASKILRVYKLFLRLLRYLRRVLISFINFIPLLILLFLILFLVYIIGTKFNWFKNSDNTVMNLITIIISVFFTSYVISFVDKERQRRKTLKIHYAFLYAFYWKMVSILEIMELVFNIETNLKYDLFQNNNYKDDEFYKIIKHKKLVIRDEFWDEIVSYDNYKISKKNLLNNVTNDMFNLLQFNVVENMSNLWELHKSVYWFFEGYMSEFLPVGNFKWELVENSAINLKLYNMMSFFTQLDNRLGSPWRRDTKLDDLCNTIYMKKEKYKSKKKIRKRSAPPQFTHVLKMGDTDHKDKLYY